MKNFSVRTLLRRTFCGRTQRSSRIFRAYERTRIGTHILTAALAHARITNRLHICADKRAHVTDAAWVHAHREAKVHWC